MYRFTGGNAEWRSFNYPQFINNKYRDIKPKKITPKKVTELIAAQDILLIDVRPGNFTKGPNFIKGALNFPVLTLTGRIEEIPRDRQIILTDWTMRQSPLAAKYLLANGFSNVMGVLKGGIVRWEAEGYPVEIREVKAKDIE